MQLINHPQGSPEWLAARKNYLTASEAPVMMGASAKMRRDDLLAAKCGLSEIEYSDFVQERLFDKGHEIEAQARAILEQKLGIDLYPVTGARGEYLASYDGLDEDETFGFECKSWNKDLPDAVRNNDLPAEYYWQLEHQLLVCESLEKIIFVCSDGTEENFVSMEYVRVPGRAEKLIRSWQQFRKDMDSYEHVIDAPKPEPKFIGALPVLNIRVQGQVVESNLDEYKEGALAFIKSINRDLQTDEDFADAEAAVKWCGEVEKKIELTKEQALSQTATIEQLFNALDEVKAEARRTRLDLDKLVTKRKDDLKLEIVQKAKADWQKELQTANAEFAPVFIENAPSPDFQAAIKGKRNFAAMRSEVGAVLANAKVELGEVRDHIRSSLQIIRAEKDHQFLFNDVQQLVSLNHDHLKMKVEGRIKDHKEAEERRIAAEAQRRAEEIARKEREEEARKQREKDAQAERERQAAAKAEQEAIEPEPEREKPALAPQAREEAPAPAPTTATPIGRSSHAPRKARPADHEIIDVLKKHFSVHDSVVIEWLQAMDLEGASEKQAQNF